MSVLHIEETGDSSKPSGEEARGLAGAIEPEQQEQQKTIQGAAGGSGSFSEIIKTSWPIVISMLSYTAMGVADTLLVGWLGKTELAAVGLATTVFFLVNAFFMGTLQGVKVVASQATGAGQREVAVASAWHGMAMAVPFGLAVVALAGLGPQIFAWMGGGEAVQQAAAVYFGARVFGAPIWYVFIAQSSYMQGAGDTRTPMVMNLIANGANIALDLVLIFGIGAFGGLGMVGAAIATVIAQAVAMLAMSVVFARRVGTRPVLRRTMWRKLASVGLPIGVRYVLDVAGFTVFTAMLARMGEDELAANMIAIKILSVSFLPGYGISEGACILVGQYIGAEDEESAQHATRNATLLSVAIMGALGLVFWSWPQPMVRLFQTDPRVVALGVQLLQIAAVFQIFDAVAMGFAGALNGAGDTRFTMFVSVTCSWFVLVPLTWLLGVHMGLGVSGAWLAMTAEILLYAILVAWRWRSGAWRGRLLLD